MIEHSNEAIFLVDSDVHITFANAATVALSGYEQDELIGMNVVDLMHETERADVERRFAEMEARGPAAV